MKKHETYKRNNNRHAKNKTKRGHSPHNGYKYKSLFIIIIKICLACIGFYNKIILKLEKLNYFKKLYFFIKFQRKFANFEAKKSENWNDIRATWLKSITKEGTFMKSSSAEVTCFDQMKIVHNTVLKTSEL